ncbi:helicase [Sediminicola sp. YIK13]|uniref:DEAD/DEAH box helicase n=1 Tax=Sediminicola sp. YIK13 TaxID=1453352 RepID=UPI0007219EEE|nr:DEAD/DEAH box helicase [Sediminicola sp. YIK13]ALM07052.1 helicase [Sediminicola sp. YIK13]
MANTIKERQDILEKLNIHQLNPMQEEALSIIETNTNTIILSPTGTGKTLAFLLPLIDQLDPGSEEIQALILVPSRELAIQIEQVIREMGSGYKVNAVYGGRAMAKDKLELKHTPAILIGTPGRIADHFDNERFSTKFIKTLVLDEFDKSLQVGFEEEMKYIIGMLPSINRRILTSATLGVKVPTFVRLDKPIILDYLKEENTKLAIKTVVSASQNKQKTVLELLNHIGNQPGIIFCNLRETVEKLSTFLERNNVSHGCFHGDMEQKDRERSLIKFRNGSNQIIVATDLAARGIDIPEMKFIVHYEFPYKKEEFIHRNGRTARVNAKGTAYVIKWVDENLPEFITNAPVVDISKKAPKKAQYWQTLFISGGRKDKISKGDIAGLFFKQGNINKDQLGIIELKNDCTFVAVPVTLAEDLIKKLNNTKLKKKKVRVTVL